MPAVAAPPSLSSEEQEQLQQTIEMFEVIVQASPQDTQSLEILKDAYTRLGKAADANGVARRLADTYRDLGQFSQALLEYEAMLQREPNNMEIMGAIGEVEEQLQKSGQARASAAAAMAKAATPDNIRLDFSTVTAGKPVDPKDASTLITTNQTQRAISGREAAMRADDGNETLAKFLVQHRLVPDEIVASAIDRVNKKNKARNPNMLASSLIEEICRRGAFELETLLSGILDRSKFAYIPLEYYEVDRAVVKMLPEEITLARLIVPFDVMSRTLMVAMANPFDAQGKETVQGLLDYNIQWHLASPQSINKVLAETYRLPSSMTSDALRLA